MIPLRRIILLYWLVYVLDFATSAYFILLGYGSAETNQFQRMLFQAPGPGALLIWTLNQNIWIALGAIGLFTAVVTRGSILRLYLGWLLVLFSFFRLYGAATNVGFTLQTLVGLHFPLMGYCAVLCVPVLIAFRHELRDHLRMIVNSISTIKSGKVLTI